MKTENAQSLATRRRFQNGMAMNSNTSRMFSEVVRRMAWHDKKFHVYGETRPLYSSEIHAICLVGDHPGIHGGGIAEKMGATKSAASQILSKLERRGMIVRKTAADKKTKHAYTLSPSGRRVFAYHEAIHRDFDRKFNALLARHSAADRRAFQRVLREIDRSLAGWEEEWNAEFGLPRPSAAHECRST